MHFRTIVTLGQLRDASWFSRVGIREESDVAAVASWREAIGHCDASEWEDLQGEALNQYRKCIAQRSKQRLELWNATVDEVKKITKPLVAGKISAVVRQHALPEIFRFQVNYDITGVCMEAEYADLCIPGFFMNIGNWYLKGHFPCGWWGAFPQGKLVIY